MESVLQVVGSFGQEEGLVVSAKTTLGLILDASFAKAAQPETVRGTSLSGTRLS